MSRLTLIVAATKNNGIGYKGRLPWRLPKEMAYFSRVTTHAPDGRVNAVIMGRNTWESIPSKFRPLPKRTNYVISNNGEYSLNAPATLRNDLETALGEAATSEEHHRVFVIGGVTLYTQCLALPSSSPTFVDRILLTRVFSPAFEECDTFMPDILSEKEQEGKERWEQTSHAELSSWAGFDVPEGIQSENGVEYEFQMWIRVV
ncbi:dihydrofolate reductase [Pleurotus ostreatus]|uniref:Dihydrofolate reductase n=3 Tax=Pleurotus TaxID=5320 RepID=A0A067NV14_PLEO1|nr:dihydrofolate reductase [Pleurotus ostreatus]KAF7436791.1 dihydrofolate reductase [Pleurotus ostreatus]KAG9222785.1 hypothetical protein CCMSSC00406_0000526 [Pleurotus cornucopiae]KAJ8702563.1 hypothetical protein PTI98_001270 [Pleurotus ostreatus]KDQ30820.1 hypothetical protein PLEOSDRAFT_1075071 [Pleurotus ostreatus PC15]